MSVQLNLLRNLVDAHVSRDPPAPAPAPAPAPGVAAKTEDRDSIGFWDSAYVSVVAVMRRDWWEGRRVDDLAVSLSLLLVWMVRLVCGSGVVGFEGIGVPVVVMTGWSKRVLGAVGTMVAIREDVLLVVG